MSRGPVIARGPALRGPLPRGAIVGSFVGGIVAGSTLPPAISIG